MTDEATIKQLRRQRGAIKHKLTNFISYVKLIETDVIDKVAINDARVRDLSFRVNNLAPLLQEFETIQLKLETICKEEDFDLELKERDTFFDSYSDHLAQAQTILVSLQSTSNNQPQGMQISQQTTQSSQSNFNVLGSNTQGIQLPTIALPKFKGDYNSWLEFKHLFESLVHTNNCISTPIAKYHYLKASLEGEAAKIIQSLEFTGNNYTVAWELLCTRYNNDQLLVYNHIKSLFELDPMLKESSLLLRNLIDTVYKHLRALETLQQPTNHWDALLIYMISTKLDKNSAREWEKHKVSKSSITLEEFKDFIYSRANLLETLEVNHNIKSLQEHSTHRQKNNKRYSLLTTGHKCNYCKKNHLIYSCSDFLQLSSADRLQRVKQLKLCENCLCVGHSASRCNKLGTCKSCKMRHSTLLHQNEVQSEVSQPSSSSVIAMSSYNKQKDVLLSTIKLQIFDSNGSLHTVRALLDSGSQSNFITNAICRKLNLKRTPTNCLVSGLNSTTSLDYECHIKIKSIYSNYQINSTCLILPQITETIPSCRLNISTWKIPSTIQLADPEFYEPSGIDLLIGSGHFWSILKQEKIQLSKHLPILHNTEFGWIVSGPLPFSSTTSYCNFSRTNCNEHSCHDLTKFWEVEEFDSKQFSRDDEECERFFKETVSRQANGRFIVRIPLKYPESNLGDSKQLAIKRLLQLERRFISDSMLQSEYKKFMKEYIDLGHMTKVDAQSSIIRYYLPHHGIIKNSSLTTKLRVVFNGSAQTLSGWSVNDLQHVGPPVLTDLFKILLQFRQHSVAVCADIEKMYRQILVHPADRHLQSILWRFSCQDEIASYALNTVTYGTTSAPYLAIRCLKYLADEIKSKQPVISHLIHFNFYVDDFIASFSSEEEAIERCSQLQKVLYEACFPLRKWVSNNSSVVKMFESDNDPISVVNFADNKQFKTLGITWNNISDTFMYQVSALPVTSPVTKRTMLSDISRIFDPLGLLSPCTVIAKLMIQHLWTLRLNWDDAVPEEMNERWCHFRKHFTLLNDLQIPRHVTCNSPISIEIHGFCDSSKLAYGCCIYLRSIDQTGNVQVRLLCAKTRVAPIKVITIPRLELCGALMLARLTSIVKQSLNVETTPFLWCDSQIVLHWIRTSANLLNVFIGNRVSEIQRLTNVNTWHYINTKDNPADLASRGIQANILLNCELWWSGPSWLRSSKDNWPEQPLAFNLDQIPEMKNHCLLATTSIKLSFPFERFSKLIRIKRVMAYCIRFISNARLPIGERVYGHLNVSEIEAAMNKLVQIAQHNVFSNEIVTLKNQHQLQIKNKLLCLSPFLDKNELLRVGGRLKNSSLNFSQKHPLLLCGKHLLTKLIFEHYHNVLCHAGPQLLLATVRQHYWPTSGMNVAKKVTRSCITCFRNKPKCISPIMADLPSKRVTATHAFDVVGVDYAGPIQIKDKKGRGCKIIKSYICIFICFMSKAVHLELVTELSTDCFLAALRRFISRRGKPSQLWSDNGTNFVGAQKCLHDLHKFIKQHEVDIIDNCSSESISWKFIPPNSPHFGGLWESGIKSVKFHLFRVLRENKLTYEELYTILTQIEAILNSRPLYPLSSNPTDLQPLTPAHLMIGRTLTSLPEVNLHSVPINRLSRPQLIQALYQGFWKRWSKEYLSILQQRSKWRNTGQNITVGSLVLLKQDNLPPNQWALGRITEVYPGSDNVVRVASVRTSKGVYKRAVVKLCPLPVPETDI